MIEICHSDIWDIVILVRGDNGKRRVVTFGSRDRLIEAVHERIADKDDILMVIWSNILLYSALGADRPLTKEDLISFFG